MMKIGDKVSVIDEPIQGRVLKIEGEDVTISTDEGFDMSFNKTELVVEIPNAIVTSYEDIEQVIQEKKEFKKRPKRPAIKPKKKEQPPMEVDLHIHKLVKSTKGMTNHDMVTLQLDTAKRQLDFAIHKRIPRIVFIHGVGQGVLKEELNYLFSRYDNVKLSEADYKKYGLGATEVYILQNPKQ